MRSRSLFQPPSSTPSCRPLRPWARFRYRSPSRTKSNLAPVTIAANAPGIYTATGAGTRPGILQNFSPQGVPANSPRLAATPGQTAVLWLTGHGPITAADNQASLSELLSVWRNSTRASQKMGDDGSGQISGRDSVETKLVARTTIVSQRWLCRFLKPQKGEAAGARQVATVINSFGSS